MATAKPAGSGWIVEAPEQVGAVETLIDRLQQRAGGLPVAFGIDCPIGIPRAYARLHASEQDFPSFLRSLDTSSNFLTVASNLDQISPSRPFYPHRGISGMTRHSHATALGLQSADDLCRACDRATAERPAGAPVFWTLGANQSGKAAISAWRDLLIPALRGKSPPRVWPFEGPFRSLLVPGSMAIAETYPAEALRQLGLIQKGSKRRRLDRAAYAPSILKAMSLLAANPAPDLGQTLADGFGDDDQGEDRFDCLLGVLCVLSVLTGNRTDTAPDDFWIRNWEGWVLGQTALPHNFSFAELSAMP